MRQVFVFGSNLAGIHGAGAALEALRNHGAIRGHGIGLKNNSYAIPTKDERLRPLSLQNIAVHVSRFIQFALEYPTWEFTVTAIGTGLAGHTCKDMAQMFRGAPDNVKLPKEFLFHLRC